MRHLIFVFFFQCTNSLDPWLNRRKTYSHLIFNGLWSFILLKIRIIGLYLKSNKKIVISRYPGWEPLTHSVRLIFFPNARHTRSVKADIRIWGRMPPEYFQALWTVLKPPWKVWIHPRRLWINLSVKINRVSHMVRNFWSFVLINTCYLIPYRFDKQCLWGQDGKTTSRNFWKKWSTRQVYFYSLIPTFKI